MAERDVVDVVDVVTTAVDDDEVASLASEGDAPPRADDDPPPCCFLETMAGRMEEARSDSPGRTETRDSFSEDDLWRRREKNDTSEETGQKLASRWLLWTSNSCL